MEPQHEKLGSPPAAAKVATKTDLNAPGVPPDPNGAQYLFQFLTNIKSFNLNVPEAGNFIAGQPQIGAVEKDTNNRDALGLDYNNDGKGEGYNIPSLLGIHYSTTLLSQRCLVKDRCVVADVDRRTAGLPVGASAPLVTETARNNLVRYLESIDKNTPSPPA